LTLRDIADLTGADIRSIVKHSWDRFRRRRAGHRILFDLSGLTPSAVARAMSVEDRHPWLNAPRGTLPGKAAHVALLMRAQMSIELYPRRTAPPHIAPLLSQPIVELCLSIPSWLWVTGGRNRAVARAAFEDLLPKMLIARSSKGSPGGFMLRIHEEQAVRAVQLLRGGRLVEEGIVEPDFVDRAIRKGWRDDGGAMRLLAFAGAETWIRWWEGSERLPPT
jgi:asparagine synthase (glutamine-hydrolysing)